MSTSDTKANAALDALYGDAHASTFPSSLRVRLYIGDPADTGVEPAAGGYAAVTVANTTANFPAASGRQKENGTDIVWPTSSGDWGGVCTHWALTDAAGDICASKALPEPIDVNAAGVTPRAVAGALVITFLDTEF